MHPEPFPHQQAVYDYAEAHGRSSAAAISSRKRVGAGGGRWGTVTNEIALSLANVMTLRGDFRLGSK
jgi:hypothetical protein